jgi:hypothetical protein
MSSSFGFARFGALLPALFFCHLISATPAARAAHGRVLFLDLNIASEEVQTLKKAESTIGDVTILPRIDEKDRARLNQLLRKALPNLYKRKDACKDNSCRQPLQTEITSLEQEKNTIQSRYKFTARELDQELAKFERAGVHFDTMVISGHDGTGDMYGDIGVMPMNQLKEVMEQHPAIQKSIRTVGLWGCYTTAPPKVGEQFSTWEPIFPEAQLIMGFNPMSPKSSVPANLSTLKGALEKRDALIATSDKARFGSLVKEIPNVHPHFAALQTGCDYYATPRSVNNVETLIQQLCKNSAKNYQKFSQVFQCYYQAQQPSAPLSLEKWQNLDCLDVPQNVGDSALRATYNFLQDTEKCSEYLPELKPFRTSITKTIRLIFFKEVMANFAKYYSKQLKALPELLSATQAPADLKVPDLLDRNTKRSELLRFMTRLGQHIQSLDKSSDSEDRPENLKKLLKIQKNMSTKLYQLSCVPFGWVEHDSIEEPDQRCS